MQFTFTYLFTQNRVSPWKHTKQNIQKYKHKWIAEQSTLTEQKSTSMDKYSSQHLLPGTSVIWWVPGH